TMSKRDWSSDVCSSDLGRAIALAPGRMDFRLRDADVAMLRGAVDAARSLLGELSALAADPVTAEGAKRRLRAIDAAARARPPEQIGRASWRERGYVAGA